MQKVSAGPQEYTELRGFGAAGGVALTTALALTSIPINATYISLAARNFVGAGVARFLVNPRLTIVATTDLLVTPGVHTDEAEPTALSTHGTQVISDEMQDGDSEDFAINDIDTLANGSAIYVGSWIEFRGAAVELNNKNDTASVLTVKAWDGASWTDTSNADGTDDGGDTMKQSGDVTWTVPTNWKKTSLVAAGDTVIKEPWSIANLYWTRWEFSAALDSTVALVQLRALNRSTDYAPLIEGEAFDQLVNGDFACVEALTDAGTANLAMRAGVTPKLARLGQLDKFR